MFSSRSFIVYGLTFRPLIHFEFIFVYGVRKCSGFILLQVVDQFSQQGTCRRLQRDLRRKETLSASTSNGNPSQTLKARAFSFVICLCFWVSGAWLGWR